MKDDKDEGGSADGPNPDRFPGQAAIAFVLALTILMLAPYFWMDQIGGDEYVPTYFAVFFFSSIIIIWAFAMMPRFMFQCLFVCCLKRRRRRKKK